MESLEDASQVALDIEGGRVYVAGMGVLRSLDAATFDVLGQVSMGYAPRFLALAVDAVNARVYLAYEDQDGHFLAQYDAATLAPLVATVLPGRIYDLVPDPNRGQVYVTLSDGDHSLFWTLDSDGSLVDEQMLGEWTDRALLALDPEGDRLFLGRDIYGDYGITVLDLGTGRELDNVTLDQAPNGLTWDGASERLLASHTYVHQVSVVDLESGQVAAVWPTALDLDDLALDAERGHLYITDSAGRLRVLDADSDVVLAWLVGEGRISVDSPHGRLYTGGRGASHVRVFDSDRLQQMGEIESRAVPVADAYNGGLYLVRGGVHIANLETMTVTGVISDTLPQLEGYSPNPSAVDAVVDAGSGRVFAIINNGTPGSNNGNYLYVYEPLTYQKVLTDTERSASFVDVDPGTGRAYVSRAHLAGRSSSLWEEGQGYTGRLDAAYGPLRVDPALGRVYLSMYDDDRGTLLILDAATLHVLDSVPIPGGYALRALDPERHWLYLASDDGRVQIWKAIGGERPQAPAPPAAVELQATGYHRLFLAPGDEPIFGGSLFRSDDEGGTWWYAGGRLPRRQVGALAISPEFHSDGSLFASLMATDEGHGVWRSDDAGQSWRVASQGLSDLAVTHLAISPAFGQDGTLFAMTRRGGLFRSTDGAQSWELLSDRYLLSESPVDGPGSIFVSPTYGQDQTLFVSHDGLQRSTDGGETWKRQMLQGAGSMVLSPEFATDGTAFGWFSSSGVLRTSDGGQTWQPVSAGLPLSGYGTGRLLISPAFAQDQILYLIWRPSASDLPARFFRSTDGAGTWQRIEGEIPQGATPVELSADGSAFLALDNVGHLVRWPVASLNWQPLTRPALDQVVISELVFSPGYAQDQTLYAASEGAGILRSIDGGRTWTDTGFPIRTTFGGPPQLVILPPQTLYVGAPLGLYRAQDGGPWKVVGGGLPQGVRISSPRAKADGSLAVLVHGQGETPHIYLSADGGQTWTQPVPEPPVFVDWETLLLSPAFAADGAAFAAQSWGQPQRILDGGEWEAFGPPGEWTASALQMSPAFESDELLLMRLHDNSLWRSTDRGDSWTGVDGPWGEEAPRDVAPTGGYVLKAVTFSPAFAQDGVLLSQAGRALYRSAMGGQQAMAWTWSKVLDIEPSKVSAYFVPDYDQSGEVYLLQGRNLYHSQDRGTSWQSLPPAPWPDGDEVRMLLSPAHARDRTLLAWMPSGRVYESRDGGHTWVDVSQGLPGDSFRQVAFAPDYATSRLIYLVPHQGGLYKRVGEGAWLPATESVQPATPVPPATLTPPPRATSTATSRICEFVPLRFASVWDRADHKLGCPHDVAQPLMLAEQPFERGLMIWESDSRQIYVLLDDGTWQALADTWIEGVDPAYDSNLPPPPVQPQRGFGKVWREQLGGPEAAIGWALANERAVDGWRQQFDGGMLVWTDAVHKEASGSGTAYVLYGDGTWEAMAVPRP
jgi:photosystem II stability/assembly factor-like uncharacterized protein